MLTTRALGAPHPLAHNVIGEGLHWLHAVAQPDTAIINPRLAAIIVAALHEQRIDIDRQRVSAQFTKVARVTGVVVMDAEVELVIVATLP